MTETLFDRTTTIDERFAAFHEANPHVLDTLERLAQRAFDAGATKLGVKMLWEVMRYDLIIATRDPNSDYRLNNNYHSRYARLLMRRRPEWRGRFETRALAGDRKGDDAD